MKEKIKEAFKSFCPYGAVMVLLFFGIPLFYGVLPTMAPFVVLATVNPLTLAVLSVVFVIKNEFKLSYHIFQTAIFAISVFCMYFAGNPLNTLPYAIYYVIITLIFSFVTQMLKGE